MNQQTIHYYNVNNVKLACIERGSGPLVLCLHGFPDTAYSFDGMLAMLAEHGYRAVAPFLRGYYPSGLAADNDYSIPTVAQDIIDLIAALGEEKAIIIGHDWGGFAAYTAANLKSEMVEKLVVMAVPHMHCSHFSWGQLKKSWYVMLFQLPRLAEYLVARDNFQFIDRLYRSWCPSWNEQAFNLRPVKQALGFAGGLKAALAYYRAMIRGSNAHDREIMSRQTSVPSLWLVGDEDGSVGVDQFKSIDQAFTGPFELVIVAGAGHFVHRESAPFVEGKILGFLQS